MTKFSCHKKAACVLAGILFCYGVPVGAHDYGTASAQQPASLPAPESTAINQSAFTRAVAAGALRNQALVQWRSFQQTGDDASLASTLKYLAEAIALAPDSKATWQLAARVHYSLKYIPDFKVETVNSLEKLAQLDPENLSSRILLVDELISLAEWQRAILHLEAIFSINQPIAVDTVLDRMVLCYLKAEWQERGAAFFRDQLATAYVKEPLLISGAVMERRMGDNTAAYASLGQVLFSQTASRPMRAKARQLKTFWQEIDTPPVRS
ncbi:tetratricopeptide repeat protein [Kordiimonas sp.]|uniref:tetratricopeptide repeat protein n=1 Tax=Kordiimonas sp. TaxID=1970157 RepID=UPI003A908ECF